MRIVVVVARRCVTLGSSAAVAAATAATAAAAAAAAPTATRRRHASTCRMMADKRAMVESSSLSDLEARRRAGARALRWFRDRVRRRRLSEHDDILPPCHRL